MATFTKKILSSSVNGRATLVAATSSPGTTIHTGSSASTTIEEIWLYVSNPDTTQHTLTIQWGGTTSPDDYMILYVPAQSGWTVVAPGFLLQGNVTPLVIRAFADTANKIAIIGYVNEIA